MVRRDGYAAITKRVRHARNAYRVKSEQALWKRVLIRAWTENDAVKIRLLIGDDGPTTREVQSSDVDAVIDLVRTTLTELTVRADTDGQGVVARRDDGATEE